METSAHEGSRSARMNFEEKLDLALFGQANLQSSLLELVAVFRFRPFCGSFCEKNLSLKNQPRQRLRSHKLRFIARQKKLLLLLFRRTRPLHGIKSLPFKVCKSHSPCSSTNLLLHVARNFFWAPALVCFLVLCHYTAVGVRDQNGRPNHILLGLILLLVAASEKNSALSFFPKFFWVEVRFWRSCHSFDTSSRILLEKSVGRGR